MSAREKRKLFIALLGFAIVFFSYITDPLVRNIHQLSQFIPVASPSPEVKGENAALVRVVKVVDGDTIAVSIQEKNEKVRLIGINSPETVDPRRPAECFGKEAKAYLSQVLSGKYVRLESDTTQQDRDKYDRLLRYVFVEDGTFINKMMVSEGYAYEYTYDIPYKYQTEFKQAEQSAHNSGKGLWSESTCSGKK